MNKDRPAGWITGILDSQRPAIRCPHRVLDHVSSLGAVPAHLWRTGDVREAASSEATELHQRPRDRRFSLHRAPRTAGRTNLRCAAYQAGQCVAHQVGIGTCIGRGQRRHRPEKVSGIRAMFRAAMTDAFATRMSLFLAASQGLACVRAFALRAGGPRNEHPQLAAASRAGGRRCP